MSLSTVKKLLKQRENIRLEFKEAYNKMPSSLFETICAFLNRDGGDILLGVRDDGEVLGINSDEIDNANNPHGKGPLHLDSFTPFPKNPYISKFFIQLGRAEELGSGIININKYLKEYAHDAHPEFIEDDIFTTVIPVISRYQAQVEAQVEAQVDLSETEWNILRHSLTHEWNVKELMKFLGVNSLSGSLKKSIKKLRENGYLQYTVINKPRSSKQRYKITQRGKDRIKVKLNANDEGC